MSADNNFIEHPDTFFSRPDRVLTGRHRCPDRADLFVVVPLFNNARWRSRWKLMQDFARWASHSNIRLYVVEVAFGHRDFVATHETLPTAEYILHLETTSEIWLKEASINLLVQRLPIDFQYLAMMDGDIQLARPDWANETVQKLQHFDVVQMWSTAQDLGPDFTPIQDHHSFVWSWLNHVPEPSDPGYYYLPPNPNKFIEFHPGFAWAWRKEAWDAVGGQIDFAILGAGDNHGAHALIGDTERTIHPKMTGPYREGILRWQDHALKKIKRNIGLVEGNLLHFWHGAKKNRKYWDRWNILVRNQYNPETDIVRDWQGLPALYVENHRQQRLKEELRQYFFERDEDATFA